MRSRSVVDLHQPPRGRLSSTGQAVVSPSAFCADYARSAAGQSPKSDPSELDADEDDESFYRRSRASIKRPSAGSGRPPSGSGQLEQPTSGSSQPTDPGRPMTKSRSAPGPTPLISVAMAGLTPGSRPGSRPGPNAAPGSGPPVGSRSLPGTRAPSKAAMEESGMPPVELDREFELRREEAKANAKARMSACYEDLISFLELNKLSGAYALAFAAHGIDTLDQLLTLDEEGLQKLMQGLRACDMDAMDEIMLLDALRASRMS